MPKKPPLEIKEDQSRSKPYFFSVPATCSATGKRERKFFETKGEAKTAREVELSRIANFGTSLATLPSDVRRDAVRAEKLLRPHGLTLYEAVKEFVEAKTYLDRIGCSVLDAAHQHLAAELARAKSVSLSELMGEFIAAKEQEQLSDDYLKQIRRTEFVFQERLGSVRACDLSTKMVREALSDFNGKLATYSAHLRVLKAALNFGILNDYLTANPAEKIKPPKQAPREVKILSNAQVKALLDASARSDREMLAFFAIGIFAGLRPTELHALDWRDVSFPRGEIFVRHRSATSKERVGRSVPIEENLKKWLKLVRRSEGAVTPSANFRGRFEEARRGADEELVKNELKRQATLAKKWDADCMRHTAASNWDASTGNIAQTALWLGHAEQVHRKHYYHPVTAKEAKEFWNIAPSKISS